MSNNNHKDGRRLPNSRFTRFVEAVLRPFYRRKVSGQENIDPSKAAVFTCNHGRTSGPLSAIMHLPVSRFHPWINACMLNREEATATMMNTFRDRFMFLGQKAKRKLIWWITRPVCHILNSFEPVPVYKGMPRESVATIQKSVEILERGDSLLIFPEKPSDRYDEESYKDFNTGFAALGRSYYRKTGKCLDFYPIWSDSVTHVFRIGKPVTYDPSADQHSEKVRIAAELKERMIALKDA